MIIIVKRLCVINYWSFDTFVLLHVHGGILQVVSIRLCCMWLFVWTLIFPTYISSPHIQPIKTYQVVEHPKIKNTSIYIALVWGQALEISAVEMSAFSL